jgi:hypothetical protein
MRADIFHIAQMQLIIPQQINHQQPALFGVAPAKPEPNANGTVKSLSV